MTKVDLFEAIRWDRFGQEKSVRSIAQEHGIHFRTVRLALLNTTPPKHKAQKRWAPVLTEGLQVQVDA